MYVLQISKHSSDRCPMFNEESKKVMVNLMQKQSSVLAKHGIKLVGTWAEFPSHEVYSIYETPTMEAFIALSREPEILAWLAFNIVETKTVLSQQEVKEMLNVK